MEIYCIMHIARNRPTLFPATHKRKKKEEEEEEEKEKLVAVKSINP
jgi:hypothetical protein